MFIADMPNVPPQNLLVLVAQANQAQANDVTTLRTLGVCSPSPSNNYSLENVVEPVGEAGYYLQQFEQRIVAGSATVSVLQQPKHGILRLVTEADRGTLFGSTADPLDSSDPGYAYLPEKGYLGKDSATVLVEIGGIKVKVVYFFQAVNGPLGNYGLERYCAKTGPYWKISANLDTNGNSTFTAVDYLLPSVGEASPLTDATVLTSWLRSTQLHGNLADLSGINVSFAFLSGGEVGQTSANTITLDSTAAGHGWYVDPTPLDNTDDYLPTSNPNVWQAKAGSDAAGKMDLLSVLLHEYGHALGLDHSAASGDFMAATLQPGQRRLPSAEELQLMSQLVAELKAGSSTGDQSPTSPAVPSLPLGALLLGRLALGRRPEDAVFDGSQALFAAHPMLQGGSLQNLQDWATQGKVTVASGGGATLQEGAASQTRLNQVFTINERDRFLSFTLAGTALDDVNGGPDDAFEVALLEADTGRSLTGALSLSHTDALLNLQANGTETVAANVTRVTNPDGSRTYRVDLAGVPAGTAVNLSFDLIGFGQAGSQVTVRDVRVSGLPQLHDDAATLLEDGTLAFDPFAQVDNAALLALGSQVVEAPAHGSVSVNADGTFSDMQDGACEGPATHPASSQKSEGVGALLSEQWHGGLVSRH